MISVDAVYCKNLLFFTDSLYYFDSPFSILVSNVSILLLTLRTSKAVGFLLR